MSLGFDVMESREGAVLHVLGSTATESRLAGVSGVRVVGKVRAAPVGPIPKAPASQDSILPKLLHGKKYPTFYGGYRTVAGYDQFESDLQKKYPDLVKKVVYGKSFTGKHTLNAVCVTEDAKNGCQLTPDVDKARFLLETRIHAREIATSEMAWRFLDDARRRGRDTTRRSRRCCRGSEIWVVPEVNPDGANISEKGITKDGLRLELAGLAAQERRPGADTATAAALRRGPGASPEST